jgi:hypothetical protein
MKRPRRRRPRSAIRRVNIGGVKYRLDAMAPLRPPKCWGDADPPNHPKPMVRVSRHAAGLEFVETLLHELIHARWWCLDETEVTEFSEEVVAVLRQFPDELAAMLEDNE